jgi:hypothetical protein
MGKSYRIASLSYVFNDDKLIMLLIMLLLCFSGRTGLKPEKDTENSDLESISSRQSSRHSRPRRKCIVCSHISQWILL